MKVQHPPPPRTYPGHLKPFVVLGGKEFDRYTYGVGNLNSNFRALCPMSERRLINHGGGRHAAQIGEFKDFKRKDCCFVTTWIKSEGATKAFFCILDLSADLGLE